MGLFHRQKPSGGKGGEERRRYPRSAAALRINYQIGNEPAVHYNCVVRDISEGGIRLSLYQRVARGSSVRLQIYLPDAQEPTLVFGKVVWERETSDKEYPYDAGIEFNLFDPAFRLRIQKYIQGMK